MRETDFPPDVAKEVIDHANESHADLVLSVSRVHGGVPDATAAQIIRITPRTLSLKINRPNNESHEKEIAFTPPIYPLDTVQARLVALAEEAIAVLDEVKPMGESE